MNAQFPQRVRPISIAILAMGGEGGGVLADWIVAMAEAGGYLAQLTSIPGVAQRTGATIYYLELFPKALCFHDREPVMALMPMPGEVDIVVASELMEAGRAIQRGLVTPERTTLLTSTNRVFSMTEKTALTDGRVDEAALIDACRSAARTFYAFNMAAMAEATGSVMSAVMLGALAGAKALPFERPAFEAAIRHGGLGVEASLQAFSAGFEATLSGETPVAKSAPPPTLVPARIAPALAECMVTINRTMPEPARAIVRAGFERVADFQSLDYAHFYLKQLEPILALEQKFPDHACRLLQETARQLALAMTYEDTIRVAELKIRPSRFDRVREEAGLKEGQILEIAEFMHPRTQEIADTLPAPLGRWILRTSWVRSLVDRFTSKGRRIKTTSVGGFLLLYLVASLKPLRPRSLRYVHEQESLRTWLDTVTRTAEQSYDLAVEVAACRGLVKGYGDTHERASARYATLLTALPNLMDLADGAAQMAVLRKAAGADETGAALAKALKVLSASAPAPGGEQAAESALRAN
jgi:indolepyruvate ferredoxin oxidoreductase beta subunit